jgi:hypothetical protein
MPQAYHCQQLQRMQRHRQWFQVRLATMFQAQSLASRLLPHLANRVLFQNLILLLAWSLCRTRTRTRTCLSRPAVSTLTLLACDSLLFQILNSPRVGFRPLPSLRPVQARQAHQVFQFLQATRLLLPLERRASHLVNHGHRHLASKRDETSSPSQRDSIYRLFRSLMPVCRPSCST